MCKYLQINFGAIYKHVHTYQSENLCSYFTTLGFSMTLCTPALCMNTNMYDVCVWYAQGKTSIVINEPVYSCNQYLFLSLLFMYVCMYNNKKQRIYKTQLDI